ncbi:MAG: outer membrane lipoprotein carrier protein LolA [Gemmatimonadales bacterium]|nr:outer membrane lipoprotein carrier protein LolA [Gemmatimonadales bacterium]MYL05381.1 outer membrane lipoprotein carrier protein LolA [Gemmatimonadales bacterium]
MRLFRSPPTGPWGAGLLAAGFLASAFTLACSDADSAEVAEARARIEAEFGPRDAPAGPAATGDAASGQSEPRLEEPEEADGAAPSEDPPVPAPDLPDPVGTGPVDVDDGPAPADDDPGPVDDESGQVGVDSLLALANSAYASLDRLKAAFAQRIENPLLGRTREGRGTWYQAGRNRFRMDFDEPAGDIYVADGSCLWLYEPSLHDQVMVSSLEEGVEIGTVDILGRLLSQARTTYDAVDEGTGEIDGVETRIVSLTPRELPARYVEVRLWIGVSDRYVRRFRIREENQTLRTVTLSPLEPQARIDPGVFEYAPPEGVPVFPDDVRCD